MIFRLNLAKLTFLTLCFLMIFGFFVSKTNAQVDSLTVSVIPKFPGPFENVTILVEDYSRDLNKVNISWSVGGRVEQSGIGSKRFQTTSGALGSSRNISINMGGVVRQVVLRPTTSDLLWQADTYTPPFYKGKALHSNQDPIIVVAEPYFVNNQGVRLDPEKLIYKWKQNGKIDNTASGYGKRSFRVIPSILLKPTDVEVEISSPDNSFHSISSINIPDSQTEVLLYENHPLYGIRFEQALNNKEFSLGNEEMRVIGLPLFFSNEQRRFGGLSYNWFLNNTSLSDTGNEVIFRKPEGINEGQSQISLRIKNNQRFMQFSDSRFLARFTNQEDTQSQNIF